VAAAEFINITTKQSAASPKRFLMCFQNFLIFPSSCQAQSTASFATASPAATHSSSVVPPLTPCGSSLCGSIKFFIDPIEIFTAAERRYHAHLMHFLLIDFYTRQHRDHFVAGNSLRFSLSG
jgi:hypothetical protein